jgi:uncharacterized RDD family membrane protein YckC
MRRYSTGPATPCTSLSLTPTPLNTQRPGVGMTDIFGDAGSSVPLAYAQPVSARGPRTWEGHVLAPWWSRVCARLIDGVLVAGLAFIAGVVTHIRWRLFVTYAGPLLLGASVGTLGYTPGRRLLRIRPITETGGVRIGVGRGVLHEVAHLLDAVLLGLGYLWPVWDERAQTFADKLVRSVVITAPAGLRNPEGRCRFGHSRRGAVPAHRREVPLHDARSSSHRGRLARESTIIAASRLPTANSAATSPKIVKASPSVRRRKTGTRASRTTPSLRP